ncbi:MAG: heavy-metal-associated domain-containing protein [Pirellulales bacterium]|nr:heavy-metal-associated domain-containing protein [Pirellulales bacterium]
MIDLAICLTRSAPTAIALEFVMLTPLAIVAASLLSATQAEPAPDGAKETEPVATTFLISGLHCPPCASTVERSLRRVKGVRSVKVDYGRKSARVEIDESSISAQQIAQAIAGTPHMMGGSMHYSGWLFVSVAGLTDKANAKKATDALMAVPGVAKVQVQKSKKLVAVQFATKGKATTAQLLTALADVGLEGTIP